jgi:hypothetical protein
MAGSSASKAMGIGPLSFALTREITRNDRVTETKQPQTAVAESDRKDIFICLNGRRVAKRGHPNTPHARKWIPLEPGFAVYDAPT